MLRVSFISIVSLSMSLWDGNWLVWLVSLHVKVLGSRWEQANWSINWTFEVGIEVGIEAELKLEFKLEFKLELLDMESRGDPSTFCRILFRCVH